MKIQLANHTTYIIVYGFGMVRCVFRVPRTLWLAVCHLNDYIWTKMHWAYVSVCQSVMWYVNCVHHVLLFHSFWSPDFNHQSHAFASTRSHMFASSHWKGSLVGTHIKGSNLDSEKGWTRSISTHKKTWIVLSMVDACGYSSVDDLPIKNGSLILVLNPWGFDGARFVGTPAEHTPVTSLVYMRLFAGGTTIVWGIGWSHSWLIFIEHHHRQILYDHLHRWAG